MAKVRQPSYGPAPEAPAGRGTGGDDPEFAAIKKRLKDAQTDRNRHRSTLDEIMRFAMPWRPRFDQTERNRADAMELFDSTAITSLHDFGADLMATLTPIYADWLEVVPAKELQPGALKALAPDLKRYQDVVFSEMRRSNFYEAAQEAYRDVGAGTMAMIIEDHDISRPIHCQAVPITDLFIGRGPFGGVDDRFRELNPRHSEIAALWPKAEIDEELAQKIKASPDARCKVHEGLTRDWSDRGNETWKHCVFTKDKKLIGDQVQGMGSCSLITARWSTDSTTAWGIGPLYTCIPDIKTVNKLVELILRNAEKAIDPPFFYDDDGVINLDEGLVPGAAIPRLPGSKADTLESSARFDVAFLTQDDLRQAIRRALFQDGPHQRGDTPPTATQWMEEAAATARRIGAPIGRLVTEWQIPIFQRFAYILAVRGVLPPVKLQGEAVQLNTISPLLRAQRQEEAVRIDRWLEVLSTRFGPQVAQIIVNLFATAEALREAMGVPPTLVNSEEQIAAGLQALVEAAAQKGMAA